MNQKSVISLALIGSLSLLSSCTSLDTQQQRMLSGGATGAVVGTLGTVITGGCIPCGTAIGGAVGTGVGYVMDQMDRNTRANTPASPQ